MRNRHEWLFSLAFAVSLAVALPVWAQEADPSAQSASPGWRRFGQPQAADPPTTAAPSASESVPAQPDPSPAAAPTAPESVPAQIVVPAGSFITVRVNQPLSSDHNQPGDAFTATLTQPLVADGRVVARRGQTVGGRVVEAEKAGRVKGTSRLGLELTEISLVDGQQLPVRTQLIEGGGGTSKGRDAAAIGTTTGIGAAIGAAADGGFGAGMGALAGAAASTIGVLVTRGRATEIYPETALTFRLDAPVTISTERAQEAFQPVQQGDYGQPALQQRAGPPPRLAPPTPYYAGYSYYPYWGYPYSPFFYGPGFYGPSFYFYSGPRFYRGRGFYRGRR